MITTSSVSDSSDDGDDFFLRELAKELKEDEKAGIAKPVAALGAAFVLVRALDYALDVVGRMGKEFIFSALEERHDLRAVDILNRPGQWRDALRDILDESYEVTEMRLLQKVEEETGLRDRSLESTVELLKRGYE
jgi:hypothetical protein